MSALKAVSKVISKAASKILDSKVPGIFKLNADEGLFAAVAADGVTPVETFMSKNALFTAEPGMVKIPRSVPMEHGSPHKFSGEFDESKLLTGEGHIMRGWGFYFSERPEVHDNYLEKFVRNNDVSVKDRTAGFAAAVNQHIFNDPKNEFMTLWPDPDMARKVLHSHLDDLLYDLEIGIRSGRSVDTLLGVFQKSAMHKKDRASSALQHSLKILHDVKDEMPSYQISPESRFAWDQSLKSAQNNVEYYRSRVAVLSGVVSLPEEKFKKIFQDSTAKSYSYKMRLLAEEDEILNLDAPLPDTPRVRQALRATSAYSSADDEVIGHLVGDKSALHRTWDAGYIPRAPATGQELMDALWRTFQSDRPAYSSEMSKAQAKDSAMFAALKLRELGFKGTKFKDGSSRKGWGGPVDHYNYVVFDPDYLEPVRIAEYTGKVPGKTASQSLTGQEALPLPRKFAATADREPQLPGGTTPFDVYMKQQALYAP